jgi:hypothetical protein
MGYERLDAKGFSAEEEPSITGKLVVSMDTVIDDPKSKGWVKHLHVKDDPPVNDGNRTGKRRKRIDIEVVSAERMPRNHFSFEAKRLGKNNPISDYLGPDGLGRFLGGEYAANENDAGMLGYLQSATPADWASGLAAELTDSAKEYAVCASFGWKEHVFSRGPEHTFHTRHARKGLGRDLNIYHTLLSFC